MYSEENAVKMRSFKSFSLRLGLRRFSDSINREIDAMKILTSSNQNRRYKQHCIIMSKRESSRLL
jgi:hypothetical protein